MKLPHLLIIITLSILTALATTALDNMSGTPAAPTTPSVPKETSYERVIRTGTLRCGYQYWDGGIMKDEKTGQLYGPLFEIANAIGSATGLKIEWAQQVGWSDVGPALKTGKIDAMCGGMWANAAKAKEISFSTPFAYQALEAFVRDDDHRFDGDLGKLDDPNVKLAVIERDNSDFIAMQDFPKASKVSLGELNGTDSELMVNVMTGKADSTFTVTGLWQQFNKTNPGKLRPLAPDHKLRVFGLTLAIDNDDPRLLNFINVAVEEIRNDGLLTKILDKANADFPDMYIKPLNPFP